MCLSTELSAQKSCWDATACETALDDGETGSVCALAARLILGKERTMDSNGRKWIIARK
jgi:hypothetical protein